MKVSIRQEDEVSGWLRKSTEHALYVKVSLNPAEREALKDAGLEQEILVPYAYKGVQIDWTFSSVIYVSNKDKESRFVAPNAVLRAKLERVIEAKLRSLKKQIDDVSGGRTADDPFDL